MAADRRPNKNAATEDEVGLVHKLVTTLHSKRLEEMLKLVNQGANIEDVIGDGKALAAAGKWAADQNSITCAAPEMNEETELSKRLRQIKEAQQSKGARATGTDDNIIPFVDGEE
ncbi:terminase small subunit [Vibrio phage phi-A318]|uniref:Small terminase-like protein n=2 Tax=Kaohsiungvirus TaxID=2731674 RepID=A0A067YII8_9CAUD|nr:terminase small subunit [Vibrio phage phi-A318]YP_009783899.1 terminase small subunit [Vibrio phage AS51]AGZ17765.1 small terminase subunit-like protein [Vibrio phage phi-A318]AHC94075.1 small terminase-like protein [Vibrio phage AS51]